MGDNDFEVKCTETIISTLVQQVSRLAEVAQTQPQAAHAALYLWSDREVDVPNKNIQQQHC